jgi:hydroxycarboxylate dehydrogenase B
MLAVTANSTVLIPHQQLIDFSASLFESAGIAREESRMVASSLVESNLCGHESHGVVRVIEYLSLLERGELHGSVPLEILTETPALAACDAGFGFGQVQMRRLLALASRKARSIGVACVTLRNCGHIGRLGEWVERLALDGFAAQLIVNDNGVLKCVAPPGGTEPCISTNPIAIAVPGTPEPLVLDLSTSVVANGKIRVAQISGEQCPDGWLIDADGQPTNDPNTRFADRAGTILSMAGYKGFWLGLFFDMLVGGLSGGHCPPAPEGVVECNNVLLIVFDPEQFPGPTGLKSEVEKLVEFVRSNRRQAGVDAIRLPGDRSRSLRDERRQNGVPLDAGTWSSLCELAKAAGIEPPSGDRR